jgi:HprK-related kinase A
VTVGELPRQELAAALSNGGLTVRTGPFLARLQVRLPELVSVFQLLYADFLVEPSGEVPDFPVVLGPPSGLRRWWRPQVVFCHDGVPVFWPFPRRFALPLLEWGLNWCVYSHGHRYLILHAAVVERNGQVLLMPGPPGSGKSTLCAALVHRGWRLLSDELALVRLVDRRIAPVGRPISLKGAAIDVLKSFAPQAVFGPTVHDTRKGAVAHVRPPSASVARAAETAEAAWIVLPRYDASAQAECRPMAKGDVLLKLVANAFNYGVHGVAGFTALADIVDRSACYAFRYRDLEEAVACLDGLTRTPSDC